MHDRLAVPLPEARDHRPRRGRAADEHVLELVEVPAVRLRVEHAEDAHPDRRHPRGDRDAFQLEVLEQRLGIEERPWKDDLRPDHQARIGIAPRVGMEHRHDRQQRLLLGHVQAERRDERLAEAVQDGRAVRVEDALGHPGRAARVAHGRRRVLVEPRVPVVVRVGAGEQLLVAVLDDEDVLDRRLVGELLPERQQRLVHDQSLVAGVRGDVAEVVRVQAQVEGVKDEAAAGDPEIGLQMLVVVPAERRDAVARLQPDAFQRHRELPRSLAEVRERVAVKAPVRHPRHDLLVREVRLRPLQDRRQRQLEVHHQALHDCSFPRFMRSSRSSSLITCPSRST